jgi:ATP-binding cassette subfamily D (ALD) long-chain fatty acid import protein
MYLGIHSTSLLARTLLSLYIAHLQGMIVKQIVERNWGGFVAQLTKFFAISIPASLTNSVIRYMEAKLVCLAMLSRSRFGFYRY